MIPTLTHYVDEKHVEHDHHQQNGRIGTNGRSYSSEVPYLKLRFALLTDFALISSLKSGTVVFSELDQHLGYRITSIVRFSFDAYQTTTLHAPQATHGCREGTATKTGAARASCVRPANSTLCSSSKPRHTMGNQASCCHARDADNEIAQAGMVPTNPSYIPYRCLPKLVYYSIPERPAALYVLRSVPADSLM